MLAGADLLGALEHHVFEQMGEAGAALALVARAGVVGDGDREHGRAVIFGDDHAQAVLELGVGERDARLGRRHERQAAGKHREGRRSAQTNAGGIGGPPSLECVCRL